jgi:hypothetical protein
VQLRNRRPRRTKNAPDSLPLGGSWNITPHKRACVCIRRLYQRNRADADDAWSICYLLVVLPNLTDVGELPPGVHIADWQEFESRFGGSSPRRLWLLSRLRTLLDLAGASGELRRLFVWGSFVTEKPAPRDLDVLLIMSEDFEVDRLATSAQAVFDSTRAKLLFESDVFWARASIGEEVLDLWLDTYQTSRSFRKRGIVELVLP